MEHFAEIIAGLFAFLSVYLAWRLGEQGQGSAIKREVRREKENLYESICAAFENVMIEIIQMKDKESVPKIIALNAKVMLYGCSDIEKNTLSAVSYWRSGLNYTLRPTPKPILSKLLILRPSGKNRRRTHIGSASLPLES